MACSEIVAHASSAVAKPPKAPFDALVAGAVEGLLEESELPEDEDDGALPAVGAEQAVSAMATKRAETVNGRAKFFTVHISWFGSAAMRRP